MASDSLRTSDWSLCLSRTGIGVTYKKIISLHTLARDIAENLESALEQFKNIYEDLEEDGKSS
jgi:hypothetical protein